MTATPLPDLQTEADICQMVDSFYARVDQDELLNPVFNDFAKVDWEEHLPVMYSFWNSVLFGAMTYKGRPFLKHIPLPIKAEHFERWLQLFSTNLDAQFSGPKTEEAKAKARSIAEMFQYKFAHLGYSLI